MESTTQLCVHSAYYPRFPKSSNFYWQQEDFPNFLSPVLSLLSSAGRNPLPSLPPSHLFPLEMSLPHLLPWTHLCWQELMGRMEELKSFSKMCYTDPSKAIASTFHQERNVLQKGIMLLWFSLDACNTDQDTSPASLNPTPSSCRDHVIYLFRVSVLCVIQDKGWPRELLPWTQEMLLKYLNYMESSLCIYLKWCYKFSQPMYMLLWSAGFHSLEIMNTLMLLSNKTVITHLKMCSLFGNHIVQELLLLIITYLATEGEGVKKSSFPICRKSWQPLENNSYEVEKKRYLWRL